MKTNKDIHKFTIKTLMLILMAAAVVASSPMAAFAFELPEYVTVGLRYGNTAVNLASLKADSGLYLGEISNGEFDLISDLEGNTSVTANMGDDGILISDEDGNIIETIGSDITCCIIPREDEDLIRFNEARYRGGIMLLPDGNKITVVNRLGIDEYLYGVVNQEMSRSNPAEALKAQAIAARNFVAVKQYSHSAGGFGVCTTTHCQVYKGYEGETEETNRAVDETSGLLMYANGIPVEAYYHKNSGGHTEDSENVWYATLSYLRAVEDPYTPVYPWSLTLSYDEIRNCLETAGYDPGDIIAVDIIEKTDAGGVYSLLIEGDNATLVLQKDKIRSIFGSTKIKSSMFSIDAGSDPLTIRSSSGSTQADAYLYIVSRDGIKRSVKKSDIYISSGDGFTVKPGMNLSGNSLMMTGTGYGHRIGMSQDGAIEMAKQGFDFEEILKFYYSGVEIR